MFGIWLLSLLSYLCILEYLANVLGLLNCYIVDSISLFLSFSYFNCCSSGDNVLLLYYTLGFGLFSFFSLNYWLYAVVWFFLLKKNLVIMERTKQNRMIQSSYISLFLVIWVFIFCYLHFTNVRLFPKSCFQDFY